MKRRRRILIEIEHREFTFAIRLSNDAKSSLEDGSEFPSRNVEEGLILSCPSCGSPDMAPLEAGSSQPPGGLAKLSKELAAKDVHTLHSGDELWLCVPSVKKFLLNNSAQFRTGPGAANPNTPGEIAD